MTAYIKKDTLKDPTRVKYWLGTIIEILCIPVSIVNNRIHKAKSLLRKELEEFVENSPNVFDLLLKEDISKAKKVVKYFDLATEAINNKELRALIGEGEGHIGALHLRL